MNDTIKMIIFSVVYIVLAAEPAKGVFANIAGAFQVKHEHSCCGEDEGDGCCCHHERFSIFDENFLMLIASLGAFIMGENIEAIIVLALYKIGEWFEERAVAKARNNVVDLMEIRPDYVNVLAQGYHESDEEVCEESDEEEHEESHRERFEEKHEERCACIDDDFGKAGSEYHPAVAEAQTEVSETNIIRHGQIKLKQVDPATVKPGDTIYVKAGERVPLDGVLLGIYTEAYFDTNIEAKLDTSALTGESKVRKAKAGDEVLSGFINISASNIDVLEGSPAGMLKIRVTKEYGKSTVSRILEMVENAAEKKSHSEAFITRFARVYTPVVCGLAAALAVIGPIASGVTMNGEYAWSTWIYRALTFLVISCPCALVISVPLSFFAGIGGASRTGILIKGSNYLEALSKVRYVAFDKTGTLTTGKAGADELKPNVPEAIRELKSLGIKRVYMLSGDDRDTAERIGKAAGIDEVMSELMPDEKLNAVENIINNKQDNEQVAYAGDGINDAPVLMRADVGIAMGAMGTDAAVEAADVVLMDDDPMRIPLAIRISRKCMRIVRENIVLAIGVKAVCLILGALGLANMWMAIFADVGVMILAVLNALRAKCVTENRTR